MVSGDPDALGRLAVNLLDNAVRHAASQVSVSVRACGGVARLEVTDDGPGIPAADRERAFGRFSRLDDARSRDDGRGGTGLGLGLAIVRATAEAHGGSVALGDAGPGLRATVRLPRLDTVGSADPEGSEAMRLTSMTTADGVCEQDFILDDIPGVLWSPAGATGPPAAGPAGPRRRPAQEGAGHGGPRSPVRDQLRFRGGGHRHARVRRPAEN